MPTRSRPCLSHAHCSENLCVTPEAPAGGTGCPLLQRAQITSRTYARQAKRWRSVSNRSQRNAHSTPKRPVSRGLTPFEGQSPGPSAGAPQAATGRGGPLLDRARIARRDRCWARSASVRAYPPREQPCVDRIGRRGGRRREAGRRRRAARRRSPSRTRRPSTKLRVGREASWPKHWTGVPGLDRLRRIEPDVADGLVPTVDPHLGGVAVDCPQDRGPHGRLALGGGPRRLVALTARQRNRDQAGRECEQAEPAGQAAPVRACTTGTPPRVNAPLDASYAARGCG